MFKKYFLFSLIALSLFNVPDVRATSDKMKIATKFVAGFIVYGLPVIIALNAINYLIKKLKFFKSSHSKSGTNGNTNLVLMDKDNQKFEGDIPTVFEDLILLLEKTPVVPKQQKLWFVKTKKEGINESLRQLLPRGYLIHGEAGCGKNFLLQEIINRVKKNENSADIPFLAVTGELDTGIVAGGIGNWQRAIQKITTLADKSNKKIGFLIFNECEKIFAKRSGDARLDSHALPTILDTIDGIATPQNTHIIIIGITNNLFAIDQAIISRLNSFELKQTKENFNKIIQKNLQEFHCQDIEKLSNFVQQNGYLLSTGKDFLRFKENYKEQEVVSCLIDPLICKKFDILPAVPIQPRDINNIFKNLFMKWVAKEEKIYNDQETMATAFQSYPDKETLFNECYTITNTKPPLLYANN